jgi:hypothetical protein
MLIISTLADVPVSAFPADAMSPPAHALVNREASVTQLSTLTAQMKSLAESVAAVVASSSRPSCRHDGREPIICTYCDKRGHVEVDCYKRQRDLKRKADNGVSPETVVVAASTPQLMSRLPRRLLGFLGLCQHVLFMPHLR